MTVQINHRPTGPGARPLPMRSAASLSKAVAPRGDGFAVRAIAEPETRVIAEQRYSQSKWHPSQWLLAIESWFQKRRAAHAPGVTLGGKHSHDSRRIREIAATSPKEKAIPGQGVSQVGGVWQGARVHNPADAAGRFDAHAFQPVWVFDDKEDSFPVRPDFDGDGQVENDLKAYDHGVVGGKQALEGAFSVAQRGEYTVLTYSLHYVDNKFTNYHDMDSSTVSIYLKPDEAGKLAPAYVYTSAHYNGTLTPWDAIKKDANGHPIIRVERGSHALYPYAQDDKVSDVGLTIQPDGQATMKGRALPNRMTWLALQDNVSNARVLPAGEHHRVWDRYFGGYPERRTPFHPSLFDR